MSKLRRQIGLLVLLGTGLAGVPLTASAQQYGYGPRSAVRSPSSFGAPRYSLPRGLQRQSLSPYLNLLRGDAAGPLNYQLLVRPQIEQRNTNLRQDRFLREMEFEYEDGLMSDRSRSGSRSVRDTGHASDFLNYSHFYRTYDQRPR